jgi:hypothetical protein
VQSIFEDMEILNFLLICVIILKIGGLFHFVRYSHSLEDLLVSKWSCSIRKWNNIMYCVNRLSVVDLLLLVQELRQHYGTKKLIGIGHSAGGAILIMSSVQNIILR